MHTANPVLESSRPHRSHQRASPKLASRIVAAVAVLLTMATAAFTVICLTAASVSAQTPAIPGLNLDDAAPPDGNTLVAVTLHAEQSAISPGETILLALHFEIEPDWHIYWHNNGDSGAPPVVQWQVPSGVTIGEPRWPTPHRKVYFNGGAVDYIHAEQATLLFPLTLGTANTSSELTISADISWLVCEEVCLAGAGAASITLPIHHADHSDHKMDHEASSAEELFAAAHAALPKSDLASDITINRRGRNVVITAPNATVIEFLPFSHDELALRDEPQSGAAEGDTLRFSLDGPARVIPGFQGLVVVDRDGERIGYEVALE